MTDFKDRIIAAAKLDVRLYEEVEADTGAMGQAMGVVILSSIAAGIGSIARGGIGGILMGTIAAVVGWYILAAMVVAVRQALDYRSTLRAVGVCVIGWIIQAAILLLLFSMLGGSK